MSSDELVCSLLVPNDLPNVYWWPLIFVGLQQGKLHFRQRDEYEATGKYFSSKKYWAEIECSFRQLWDSIHDEEESPLVYFWNWEHEYCVLVSVQSDEQLHMTEIAISLPGGWLGYSGQLETGIAEQFLAACASVYRLCRPATVSLHWLEKQSDVQLLRIWEEETKTQLGPVTLGEQKCVWKDVDIAGLSCAILEPFPLYVGEWVWASLFKREEEVNASENGGFGKMSAPFYYMATHFTYFLE
jgi:hypothetical protein